MSPAQRANEPPVDLRDGEELFAELLVLGAEIRRSDGALKLRLAQSSIDQELRERTKRLRPALDRYLGPVDLAWAPLSGPQRQIWFVEKLEPSTRAHHVVLTIRVPVELDVARLERALSQIVVRHEVLRTRFGEALGVPFARVAPAEPARLLVAGDRRISAPFDLTREFPWRGSLACFGERGSELSLVVHHIVFDGWSARLLLHELQALYAADRGSEPLAPLRTQYGRYASQRAQLERSGALSGHVDYWRRTLDQLGAAALPLRRGPNTHSCDALSECERWVVRDTLQRLEDLAKRNGTTLFVVLLSALNLLIARQTGDADVVVGAPVVNRRDPDLEQLLGLFVDIQVLRTRFDVSGTLSQLVADTDRAVLGALEFAELAYDRVVAELGWGADRAAPLSVLLNVVTLPEISARFGGAVAEVHERMAGARFDLTLYAYPGAGGLRVVAAHRTRVFEGDRVAELLRQYCAILEAFAADQDCSLPDVSLGAPPADEPVTTAEAAPGPGLSESVHGARFEPARIERGERLLAAIHELERRLRDAGVATGDRVCIHADRSARLVVALWAVWRAGGSVHILDAAYPDEVLLAQATQLAPRAWLAATARSPSESLQRFAERLPLGSWAVINSDITCADLLGRDYVDFATTVAGGFSGGGFEPGREAYVGFTSGTTGEPRGVSGRHEPMWRFVDWYTRRFSVGPDDVFALLSGLSHDPLYRDLLVPARLGARLAIPPSEPGKMGTRLALWLHDARVSVLHLTPSLGRLIALGATGTLTRLRYVFFGGDALRGRDVAIWRRLAPRAQLFNFYGTTETPQAVGCHAIDARDEHATIVPIGFGVADAQLLVRGATGQAAAIGEVGRLWVVSRHLVNGYVGDPAATAERFRADSYCTGDLARYRMDGSVEYVGRADRQIKIRGSRVEPGHIEACLLQGGLLREVVVLGVEDAAGETALYAFAVPAAVEPEVGVLLNRLSRLLPPAWVPSRVELLDSLPLTQRGKLDTRALLQKLRDSGRPTPDVGRDPGTRGVSDWPLIPAVMEIFRRLLRVDAVDETSHFFELGGHSLLAARVVAEVERLLERSVPLVWLFENPNLGAFVQRLASTHSEVRARIARVGDAEIIPATPVQRSLWVLARGAGHAPPFVVADRFELWGDLDVQALEWALGELERRHETLRTVFAVEGERLVQRVQNSSIPMFSRTGEVGSLDCSSGPVWRAHLERWAGDPPRYELSLAIHHCAVDGLSMCTLARDLSTFYAHFAAGRALPPWRPAVRYADYAVWLEQRRDSAELERQRAYWRTQLGEWVPLELPRVLSEGQRVELESTDVSYFDSGTAELHLPPELVQQIGSVASVHDATPFAILLSALNVVLARWCGQTDVSVALAVGIRPPECLDTVGLFLNLVVARTRLDSDPRLTDVLLRTRATLRDALANGDVAFETLLEDSPELRPRGRAALNVFFNMLDVAEAEWVLEGVRCNRLPRSAPPARFDLSLYARPRDAGLDLRFVYRRCAFHERSMADLMLQLGAVLTAFSSGLERRLSQLELPGIVASWREEQHAPAGGSGPVHTTELLLEQVRRQPAGPAIEAAGRRLNYDQLALRVAGAARRLLVACPDAERVGLYLSKDEHLIVAALAALCAGKVYVPLDPAAPPARSQLIARDAGLGAILTGAETARSARELALSGVVLVDVSTHEWNAECPAGEGTRELERLLSEVTRDPEAAAYILYTSGSTGVPKGVVQSHRNVVHHARTYAGRLGLGPGDRVSLLSTFAFDAAVMDVYGALLSGAELCVINLAGDALLELARELGSRCITIYHSTPTLFRHLCSDGAATPDVLRHIRWVVLGGEAVVASDLEAFQRCFGEHCRFINGLGPTECTLALQYEWKRGDALPTRGVPVGTAVPGVRVHLMTPTGPQVNVHGLGEIVLESPHVALGYWRRPELDAERFVRPPGATPRYRTGDWGRWLEDGSVEFVGRADDQVKVRGHRVELAEVTACVLAAPGVREAAVIARQVNDVNVPETRLVAFLALQPGATSLEGVQRHVASRLPRWMLPSHWTVVAGLPTTATGKVDARALSAWELTTLASTSNVAASTPLEREVAATWAALLGLSEVDLDRDFFELGGNSLLAVRALQQARERWGIDMSLSRYFAGISARDVAALVEDRAEPARLARLSQLSLRRGAPRLTCLLPFGVRAGLLSPLAEALRDVGLNAMNWTIDPRAGDTSVELLAQVCADELVRESLVGPYYLAGISNAGIVALEVGAQLLRAGVEVRQVVLFDSYPPGRRVPLAAESQRALESFAAYLLASYQALPRGVGDDMDARLAGLLDVAVARGVLPSDATLGELVSMFEHDRAQREALRQAIDEYEFRLPEALDVTLLQATHAGQTRTDEIHWRRLLPRLNVVPVTGTHWGFCDPAHVGEWAQALSRVIA